MRVLDAAAVVAWADGCVRSLSGLRAQIDSINVYPVPDSDTGSNMLHTMTAAHTALEQVSAEGAGEALTALAKGAVVAARGNSGVILSQVLRGLAESVSDSGAVTPIDFAAALATAHRMATTAVARPVDGTMLTVLGAAANEAARVAEEGQSLPQVAAAAAESAARALAWTPRQLPVLADAGVVDAGGRGVLAVLDELAAVISGTPARERPEFAVSEDFVLARSASSGHSPAWEVMYLLDGVTATRLPTLRDALSELGDCVTIAGDGEGRHAVHVHCDDIGAAIDAGLLAGRPHEVRVESLAQALRGHTGGRAVLALLAGSELGDLVRAEGVSVLDVPDGHPPEPRALHREIVAMDASHVIVLPSSAELTEIAEYTVDNLIADSRDVVVIPCASPVQVLAALAVHDEHRRVTDDVVAMAEAAAATRRGELHVAEQDAITWVGRVNAGDVVGLVDDEVVLIGAGPTHRHVIAECALGVLERMLSVGGELVTVLLGAQAPDGIETEIAEAVASAHPEVEFTAYPGGQTTSLFIFGVE